MGMPQEKWEYIKGLRVRKRLVWDSSERGTYNVGNNKKKRNSRKLARVVRATKIAMREKQARHLAQVKARDAVLHKIVEAH
jgi:hypothetical protein